jgi:bilirubin oxidase
VLGTVNADGTGNPLAWMDPCPRTRHWHRDLGDPQLHGRRASDSHPSDAVPRLDRAPFDPENPSLPPGPARPPEAWETGAKDTVVAYPGEITRLVAKFDLKGSTCGTATSSITRITT